MPVSVRSKGGPAPTSSAARCSLPSFRRAMIATRSMVGSSLGGNALVPLGRRRFIALALDSHGGGHHVGQPSGRGPQCFGTFSLVTRTDEVQAQWPPARRPRSSNYKEVHRWKLSRPTHPHSPCSARRCC